MQSDLYREISLAKDVRAYMTAYIREHFASLLGDHVALLDTPDGLDKIQNRIETGRLGAC
jgi:hypothetical protein